MKESDFDFAQALMKDETAEKEHGGSFSSLTSKFSFPVYSCAFLNEPFKLIFKLDSLSHLNNEPFSNILNIPPLCNFVPLKVIITKWRNSKITK